MVKLTREELNIVRSVPVHNLLGITNQGRRISMPCPIHKGKNPNFNVYPDNSFHCFKCCANGKGSIDLCMAMGYTFQEAVVELLQQDV